MPARRHAYRARHAEARGRDRRAPSGAASHRALRPSLWITEMKHEITRADIMPVTEYVKIRSARRTEIVEKKRLRRVAVGPHATVHFENFESMWLQVQEMLYIEKG